MNIRWIICNIQIRVEVHTLMLWKSFHFYISTYAKGNRKSIVTDQNGWNYKKKHLFQHILGLFYFENKWSLDHVRDVSAMHLAQQFSCQSNIFSYVLKIFDTNLVMSTADSGFTRRYRRLVMWNFDGNSDDKSNGNEKK